VGSLLEHVTCVEAQGARHIGELNSIKPPLA
jgi:hypothetical protein